MAHFALLLIKQYTNQVQVTEFHELMLDKVFEQPIWCWHYHKRRRCAVTHWNWDLEKKMQPSNYGFWSLHHLSVFMVVVYVRIYSELVPWSAWEYICNVSLKQPSGFAKIYSSIKEFESNAICTLHVLCRPFFEIVHFPVKWSDHTIFIW